MGSGKQPTTSVLDISEIEDEPPAAGAPNGGQREQQAAATKLYLYHEETPVASGQLRAVAGALSLPASPGATMDRPADGSAPFAGGQQLALATAANPSQAPQLKRPGATPTPEPAAGGGGGKSGAAGEPQKANLGTLTGVYFPCVQNIFGVILFIRMVWIVGTAGVPAAFGIVFICCCVTLTTSISLSAIATNGLVPAGGSYFMISRSLGPECGGAVGTMFFLGTTVAGAMYITGAVEIMLNYLCPSLGLFGDFQRDVSILYHNIRVYGTLLLLLVGILVWIGVRFVSRLAPIALFCVLFSIFSIYAGIFIKHTGQPDLMICVLGDRLVTLKNVPAEEVGVAPANLTLAQLEARRTRLLCTPDKLSHIFCPARLQQQSAATSNSGPPPTSSQNQDSQTSSALFGSDPMLELEPADPQQQQRAGGARRAQGQAAPQLDEKQAMLELFRRPANLSNCDPYFKLNKHRIHLERAVPGISSGVIWRNLAWRFRAKGAIVSYEDSAEPAPSDAPGYNYVFVDISTTFTALIAIYFPSCTGILAGSNRSGDLADASRSIPRGTIAAQLTTSAVYLSCIILFGATFNNLFIRDKFGESMGGQLAVTQIAWPEPQVILVGGLLSTLGASLQSLVGAPRILQGIAKDDVIPCFRIFARVSSRGEPELAIVFTLLIAELAVLIGNLDFIAPILTISLVMCYFFINLACTLHSLMGSPNWRPRFRHYHWSVSLTGCLLCLFVMSVSSIYYFLVALLLAGAIYRYIAVSGAEKEWGDGKQGLAMSAATNALLKLGPGAAHTKNWRPQLLLLVKLKPASELEPPSSRATANSHNNNSQNLNQNGRAGSAHPNNNNSNPNNSGSLLGGGGGGGGGAELELAHPKVLSFASQLKAGKGLTMVSAVLEGDYRQLAPLASGARARLLDWVQRERVRGFADVLVAQSVLDGISYQVQTAGLGGLKHNTVVAGWPGHWRRPALPARPQSMGGAGGGALCIGAAPAAPAAAPGVSGGGAGGAGAATSPQAAATGADHPAAARPGSLRSKSGLAGLAAGRAAADGACRTRAHLFIELVRAVSVSQNALLVLKGADQWPESCDRLGGHIDVWWIDYEGGLLMLLPHLLKQHRTWRACKMRVFLVLGAADCDPTQARAELARFLYQLRIEAELHIVELKETEISDYTYERTLMMEQRGEIIRRHLDAGARKQSILLEQEIDGRLIRFRIRKPSSCSFEESLPAHSQPQPPIVHELTEGPTTPTGSATPPAAPTAAGEPPAAGSDEAAPPQPSLHPSHAHHPLRPDEVNVRRMHTALSLNEAILRRSRTAKLVIINLPKAPKDSKPEDENNFSSAGLPPI